MVVKNAPDQTRRNEQARTAEDVGIKGRCSAKEVLQVYSNRTHSNECHRSFEEIFKALFPCCYCFGEWAKAVSFGFVRSSVPLGERLKSRLSKMLISLKTVWLWATAFREKCQAGSKRCAQYAAVSFAVHAC